MKLVRFGQAGKERPGIWIEPAGGTGQAMILDVRAMAFDIEDYNAHFFARHGLVRLAALLRESKHILLPAKGVRLGPPVARPAKIICLGKNYAAHAREFDSKVPETPIIFGKASSALSGPFDPIVLPAGAEVDGEVELAVIINCRVPAGTAIASHQRVLAGYTILNDVTDRAAQKADGQWFRAKSADTFCPLGPFLVTCEEVADPNNLQLLSRLNGKILQNGSTADMLFKIPEIINFISASISLEPGDIIATGTPAGIGSAHNPPVFLKAGDILETEIEGIGCQRNPAAH